MKMYSYKILSYPQGGIILLKVDYDKLISCSINPIATIFKGKLE
jgi:hypothetical protein